MTKFIIKETYMPENESTMETYDDFINAKIAFRRIKRLFQKNQRANQVVELAPTYFAIYNFIGKLIYTCEIIVEASETINEQ